MSISFNQNTISGRLTKDAEVYLAEGADKSSRVHFSIAVNCYNDKVFFKDCTAWGKLAENVGPTLKKGMEVLVSGPTDPDDWVTKTGEKKTTEKLNVRTITYMSRKVDVPVNDSPANPTDIPF